jgi:hypothetical protein
MSGGGFGKIRPQPFTPANIRKALRRRHLPVELTEAAAAAHAKLIDKAIFFRSECDKRLAAIEEQSRAIEALQSALDSRVPTAD